MPLLNIRRSKDILFLTLDDLKSKNALSPQMAEELLGATESQDFSGIVLTHTGDTFCSGGNLRFYKDLKTKEEGLKANQRITYVLNQLEALPCPKVAFVNGPCFGGGIELLSCFNKIICTPQSLFGLWQRRIGLTYGWGGQSRLEKRIPSVQLTDWLLEANTRTAYEAKSIGLVDEILLASKGLERCIEWVGHCQKLGKESLSKILSNPNEQEGVFKELWLAEKHKKVLSSFE